MKKLLFLCSFLFCFVADSFGQARYQRGYTRKDGTHVQGHYKKDNNTTNHDNYSTKNNYNPNTQSNGTRAKDYSSGAYNYGKGHQINTGSKGGQYYNNSKGNKTYVPKRK